MLRACLSMHNLCITAFDLRVPIDSVVYVSYRNAYAHTVHEIWIRFKVYSCTTGSVSSNRSAVTWAFSSGSGRLRSRSRWVWRSRWCIIYCRHAVCVGVVFRRPCRSVCCLWCRVSSLCWYAVRLHTVSARLRAVLWQLHCALCDAPVSR